MATEEGVPRRSILKIGEGGRAITLPIEFIRDNNLRAGQKLYVLRNRVSLIVTTSAEKARRWAAADKEAKDAMHEVHEEAIEEIVAGERQEGDVK